MEGKTITVTTITFNAFDRVCQEVFYNKTIEECKLIIWKSFCNTAVLLNIREDACILNVVSGVNISSDDLSKEKYEPKESEEHEKIKSLLEKGRK
jgi:hypothetical protein